MPSKTKALLSTTTTERMHYSDACKTLVKKWESLRLKAYLCSGGVWTLGYGHTQGVKPGQSCTLKQADQWLEDDLGAAAAIVRAAVAVTLTQGQIDALTSFTFNLGPGARGVKDGFVRLKTGQPSTMLRKLNAGDRPGAAEEFGRWTFAKGKKLGGLISRRAEEKALFES